MRLLDLGNALLRIGEHGNINTWKRAEDPIFYDCPLYEELESYSVSWDKEKQAWGLYNTIVESWFYYPTAEELVSALKEMWVSAARRILSLFGEP